MKTKPTTPTAETFTLNRLATLTGRDRRTLQKRLPGKGPWTLREVLEAHESHGAAIAEALDLAQERALLAQEQRRKLARENDLSEGKLQPQMPTHEVQAHLRALTANWYTLSQIAANHATGAILAEVNAGRPAAARDAIAMGLRDGLLNALTAIATDLPPELLSALCEGLDKQGPGGYSGGEALRQRIEIVNECARLAREGAK